MDLPEPDQTFLRDLVKAARQKPHAVTWTDRDGTLRCSTLSQAEAVKLNQVAQRLKISKGEVLRRAAFVPVAKAPPPATALNDSGSEPGALGTTRAP